MPVQELSVEKGNAPHPSVIEVVIDEAEPSDAMQACGFARTPEVQVWRWWETTCWKHICQSRKQLHEAAQKPNCMQKLWKHHTEKAMTSLMRDVGFVIDAKTTEHILHRLSVGRMRHIDVPHCRCRMKSDHAD